MTDLISSDWAEQDANNTGVSPNGVSGGYSPSAIAPIIRTIRGALKRFYVQSNAMYTTTGTGSAYVLTYVQGPSAYTKGVIYRFWAHVSNAGACTLNVNSLGAKSLLSAQGLPLTANQILAGDLIEVVYNGTQFELISNITENARFTTALTVDATSNPTLSLSRANVQIGAIYSDVATNNLILRRYNASTGAGEGYIRIKGNGATDLDYNGSTVWTAGNHGAGSTLDADKLDGQEGSYYRDLTNSTGTLPNARLSGAYDGITTLGTAGLLTISTGGEAIRIASPSATGDPYITFFKNNGADVRQGYIQHTDGTAADNGIKLANDIGSNQLIVNNSGDMIYRVGSTNYPVWHGGNDGSGSLLDSDYLDGQHGSYYRDLGNSSGTLPDARLAASTYNMSSLNLTNRLQISGSQPYISLLDTTTGEYSAKIRVNANNIYMDSSTDDVNFAEVFRFELDSKRGYVNGAQIHTTSTILNIGTSASSARTALGLGSLATMDTGDLLYTGTSTTNTSFPIKTHLLVDPGDPGSGPARNSTVNVYLSGDNNFTFVTSDFANRSTQIAGTWRARGFVNGNQRDMLLVERV